MHNCYQVSLIRIQKKILFCVFGVNFRLDLSVFIKSYFLFKMSSVTFFSAKGTKFEVTRSQIAKVRGILWKNMNIDNDGKAINQNTASNQTYNLKFDYNTDNEKENPNIDYLEDIDDNFYQDLILSSSDYYPKSIDTVNFFQKQLYFLLLFF